MAIRYLVAGVWHAVANGLESGPAVIATEKTSSVVLRQLHEAGQLVLRFRQVLRQCGNDVPKLFPWACLFT